MRRELSRNGVGLNRGGFLLIATPLQGTAERGPTSAHEAVNERYGERLGDRLRHDVDPDEIVDRSVELECEPFR